MSFTKAPRVFQRLLGSRPKKADHVFKWNSKWLRHKKSPMVKKRFFVDSPHCCHGNDCPPHAVSNSPPKSSRKLLWIWSAILEKKKKASAEETKCVRITCLNFLLFIVGRYVRLTLVDNCGFSFTNSVSLIFSSCCRWLVFAIIKWSSNVFNKLWHGLSASVL